MKVYNHTLSQHKHQLQIHTKIATLYTSSIKKLKIQEQIDASVNDAVKLARSRLPEGTKQEITHCKACDELIPPLRRKAIPGVRQVEPDSDPNQVRLHLDGDHRTPDVITALVANGIRLTRIEPITPTLEDLYFAVRTKRPVAGTIAEDGGRQLTTSDGDDDDS